jgi:MFS family permease
MGLASFFTDVASEMIYPLIQSFLSVLLSARSAMIGPALGIIEGAAETTASLTKLLGGYASDRSGKRKPLVIAGYGLSAVARLLLLVAHLGWPLVLVWRFLDRVGKGVRTAPRDALLAESIPDTERGRAFGLQRAMDFAGAAAGVALAYFFAAPLIEAAGAGIQATDFLPIFWIALVPAFLGAATLFFLRDARDQPAPAATEAQLGSVPPAARLDLRRYNRNLLLFYVAIALFTLGNSSNQFLLLRSANLGLALRDTLLLYFLFNLTVAALARRAGALSDRFGRKPLLVAGFLTYAAAYAGFALVTPENRTWLWCLWPLYGLYYALTEGVEKAFVARLAPEDSRATALGYAHWIHGLGLLPASVGAGLLYALSPPAPFFAGAALALAAAVVLVLFVRETPHPPDQSARAPSTM